MSKLFAICHDGTMSGDCACDPMTFVDITTLGGGVKLGDIKDRYVKQWAADMCLLEDDEECIAERKEIQGAWVVTESTVDLMTAVVDAVDPRSDSSVYALQRALKAIAKHLAVSTVGGAPKR